MPYGWDASVHKGWRYEVWKPSDETRRPSWLLEFTELPPAESSEHAGDAPPAVGAWRNLHPVFSAEEAAAQAPAPVESIDDEIERLGREAMSSAKLTGFELGAIIKAYRLGLAAQGDPTATDPYPPGSDCSETWNAGISYDPSCPLTD